MSSSRPRRSGGRRTTVNCRSSVESAQTTSKPVSDVLSRLATAQAEGGLKIKTFRRDQGAVVRGVVKADRVGWIELHQPMGVPSASRVPSDFSCDLPSASSGATMTPGPISGSPCPAFQTCSSPMARTPILHMAATGTLASPYKSVGLAGLTDPRPRRRLWPPYCLLHWPAAGGSLNGVT